MTTALSSTPTGPRVRMQKLDTLRLRQKVHDRRTEGLTQSQLQEEFNIARGTVRDWLARPRPTDEEIEEVKRALWRPELNQGGQVNFKARFEPALFEALRQEAEDQSTSANRIIGHAIRLYLDCMGRLRRGSDEPVDVLGYRA